MEMQRLEAVQLVFSLALVQYSLIMFSVLPFGMVIYTLCYYMLEVCEQVLPNLNWKKIYSGTQEAFNFFLVGCWPKGFTGSQLDTNYRSLTTV